MATPTVWIAESAMEAAAADAEQHRPYETGGVLMGWHVPERSEYVITEVVGPGPRAIHKRMSFSPDAEWQEGRIAELYRRAGQRLWYLGDWHSHPDSPPSPSWRDAQTLRRIARSRAARVKSPTMLILGGNHGTWSPTAWRLRGGLLGAAFHPVEQLPLRIWAPDPDGAR